jgi:hypothetical protein
VTGAEPADVDELLEEFAPAPVLPPREPRELPAARFVRTPIPFAWASTIAHDPEELREIAENTLTAAGLSVWFGDSNAGKTTHVLHLAFCMVEGRPWLGKRTERGAVIWVAGEGAASVRRRMEAHRRHFSSELQLFGLIPTALSLMDPSLDVDDLIELIKAKAAEIGQPIQMVVVDTVIDAMSGGNENAVEDMARLISAVKRIRDETGAHVALIHHTGKDAAKGARGHSSLRAAVDTEIEATDKGGGLHELHVTKQRDLASKGMRLCGRFVPVELGTSQWGNSITACVVEDLEAPSEHVAAAMAAVSRERADSTCLRGFKRLLEMGVKPTDAKNSGDYLPSQLLDKGLADGFDKAELAAAMHRVMTAGTFTRGVVGSYTNRNPKYGLVLASESP